MVAGEAQGGSVLLIVGEGNRRVVQSLRLAELRVAFTYEPTLAREAKGIEEARTLQALPITTTEKQADNAGR